jgi:hypothetical protein
LEELPNIGAFASVRLVDGRSCLVRPIHPLETGNSHRLELAAATGNPAVVTTSSVELNRQPFSVWTMALASAR